MKKIYLFILALLCCWGGGVIPANAEEQLLTLGTTANRIYTTSTAWNQGLCGGTTSGAWMLPTNESVLAAFGSSTFVSGAGLYWGMGNGRDANSGDFSFTSDPVDAFHFCGRQGYKGAYVAQVYEITENVGTVNVSFRFTGSSAIGTTSFSIWRVTSGSATLLTSSSSSWEEGPHSFTVENGIDKGLSLINGDRLVFIWAGNSAGENIYISNYTAKYTTTTAVLEELDCSFTDNYGNTYSGKFTGVNGGYGPSIGVYGATLYDSRWENNTYKATINFPFAVSNTDGTKKPVTIQTVGNTSYWYYDTSNYYGKADGASVTSPTVDNINNYLWYIYPTLNAGKFTFKLYNVGAGRYISKNLSTTTNTGTALVEDAENAGAYSYTATGISNGVGFELASSTGKFITLNSPQKDGQYLWLWTKTGSTHQGSNLTIRDLLAEFAAEPTISTDKKFTLVEGATVISPSEYPAPSVVNAAIDAQADADTDVKKCYYALTYTTTLSRFNNASTSYGAPLSFTYTIKAGKWGTLFAPVNFTKPTNWTLYTCSTVDNDGVLSLTTVSGSGTKNTPYIVKTVDTTDKTFQIIGYSNGTPTENKKVGVLTGVINETTTLPEGCYILASDNSGDQAFHKIGSGLSRTAAQYKCYLTTETEASARSILYISHEDVVTPVNEVFADDATGKQSSKFIENGRVVVVKNGVKYNMVGQRVK